MDNKYYIPTIDEFYVGFEYERFTPRSNATEEECWEKLQMAVNYLTLDELDDEIIENEIRVKYLDKEDIESIGFMEIGVDEYSIVSKNGDRYMLNILTDTIELSIDMEWKSPILFSGTIKNKSELIRILKMIGYNELD